MLIDNLVTRFQNGIVNRSVGDIFASMIQPDPTRFHTYFDDFNHYDPTAATGGYVETETGAGGTVAALDGQGGLLLLTTDALDNDNEFVQSVGEMFLFATGRRAFFRASFEVSEAIQSDFVIGLQIRDTSPLAVSDGVFFQSDDGDALLDFRSFNTTNVTDTAIATVVDATRLEVAFFWDGIDRIWYGVDGTVLGSITPGASLPNTELTVSFGYQNGVAGAETMTIDYIYAAMER